MRDKNEGLVHKPWGCYLDIERTPTSVFKRITVNPGCRLSLQSHRFRSEVWYIEVGFAKIIIDDDIIKMGYGSSINIPTGSKHRVENLSKDFDLVIFEVQSGVCSEDDITRYEDDYGR